MKRRDFLKLVGACLIAPTTLVRKSAPTLTQYMSSEKLLTLIRKMVRQAESDLLRDMEAALFYPSACVKNGEYGWWWCEGTYAVRAQ